MGPHERRALGGVQPTSPRLRRLAEASCGGEGAPPIKVDENLMGLAEIARGRRDEGTVVDANTLAGLDRQTNVLFADEIDRCRSDVGRRSARRSGLFRIRLDLAD